MIPRTIDGMERVLDYQKPQQFLEDEENLRSLNQAAIMAMNQTPRESAIEKVLRYDHVISRIFYSKQISVEAIGGQGHAKYQAILVKYMCQLVLYQNGAWLRSYLKMIKESELQLRSFIVILLEYHTYLTGNVDEAFDEAYSKLDDLIDEVANDQAPDRALAAAVNKTIEVDLELERTRNPGEDPDGLFG